MASRLPWGWVLAMVCMPSFTQAEISGDLRICVLRVNFIEDTKPILPIGLFVEAEVSGKRLIDVFMIPNTALTPNGELLVVNQDNTLEIRKVKIIIKMKDHMIVKKEIKAGERVVVSKLSIATNGMLVNPRYQ